MDIYAKKLWDKLNMIIYNIKFPIYGTIILISLIIGSIFNYIYLKKNNVKKQHIVLFVVMFFSYSIIGGIILNAITSKEFSFTKVGLSSYGGAIGIIVTSLFFEKISPSNKLYIKSAIISLPLIYAISKLACLFAGCCYGIPYNSVFSVTYPAGLNVPLLPIQLIETIVFFITFVICFLSNKNKYIIEITIFFSALAKFLLDFFRYSHQNEVISVNQVISIVFIVISLIIFYYRKADVQKSTE